MSESSPTSLRGHVAALLAKYHPDKAATFLTATPATLDDEPLNEQLKQINRYWRRQLSSLAVPTHDARSYLMDDCATVDWLRHFEAQVLPLVIEHDLPVT